jgi:hypothetical protein
MSFLRTHSARSTVKGHYGQQPFHSQIRQQSKPETLANVCTYLMKRYVSNGKLNVRNCAGGQAMAKALRAKGYAI